MSDKFRRKHEAPHVRLYHSIQDSVAWRHLSPPAVKVLLALVRLDNGKRNGAIGFSTRTAADATGLAVRTCWRCLRELEDKGFIRCTEKGAFNRKVLHASLWRYTWQAWPEGKLGPTRDFEKWRPDGNSRMQNFPSPDANAALEMETPAPPVANGATAQLETPHVSAIDGLAAFASFTLYQGEPSAAGETAQRKQANPTSGAFPSALRTAAIQLIERGGIGAQSDLAKRIGCPPGTFSKFIAGRNLPEAYRDRLAAIVGRAA